MSWKTCWLMNSIFKSPSKRLSGLITSVKLEQKKTYSVLKHDYFSSKFRSLRFLSTRQHNSRKKLLSRNSDKDKFIGVPTVFVDLISKSDDYVVKTSYDYDKLFHYPKYINNKFAGLLNMNSTWKTPIRCYSTKPLQERFTHTNTEYMEYLSSFEEELNVLTENVAKLSKEERNRVREITPIVELIKELREKISEFDELHSIENKQKDEEMEKMIEEEKADCTNEIKLLETQLVDEVIGKERTDDKEIILEATAGVGGQEAMLFTAEMFSMYENYIRFKGWTSNPIDYERSELGGIRRASMEVNGVNVYKWLKYEGGVHRVQRIPQTEKGGRIHTSTMTIAILPQPTEIDVVINQKDLKIETTRATGAGGQHVNTTDSAVRVIHLPTGTIAECQEERSQIKNKEKAIKILRSRIYQKELEAQLSSQKATRKIQVGSSGRSEKIRTYNYNQDRITDHRVQGNVFNIGQFMSGGEDLDDLIVKVSTEAKFQALEAMLDEFVEKQKREKRKKKN